ncbi:hypothetical protein [Kribbella catacumbae]|uniref:hypothetical protein n=1 Tax=Kribbella catacumbae TaxID=460086 RepID=UPI000365103F|nr:hypothetical protein [Kribbella catacumbae]
MAKHVPDLTVLEKERKALGLRSAGLRYAEIAERLGYANASSARKAVFRGLARSAADEADDLRAIEGERLDKLQSAIWTKALRGDLRAIDTIVRLMGHRAKLFGLEMASKHEVTGADGDAIIVEVLPQLLPSMADTDAQADSADG